MNTPNPLIPQGSLERQSKGKSTVRIAILTIVSIHAVFFAGLLMQGCRRDENKASLKSAEVSTNQNTLPALDPGYYSAQDTPPAATQPAMTNPIPSTVANEQVGASSLPPAIIPELPTDGKAYKVTKGDTLAKIAKANGVSVLAITKANPTVEPSKLKVGQTIQIPHSSGSPAKIGFAEPAPENGPSGPANTHTVKAGETLTRIAKEHGTSLKAIRAANNLKSDRLIVGQKIKIPAASTSASSGAAEAPKSTSISKLSAASPSRLMPARSTSAGAETP